MAAYNPLAMLQERQCTQVFNALENQSYKLCIKSADSVLASDPKCYLAAGLKSVAQFRSGDREGAAKTCDWLLANVPPKVAFGGVLTPLSWTLGKLGRRQQEAAFLDEVCKAQPSNSDFGVRSFEALIKQAAYQRAQQTALRLHKDFKDAKYFWWSMQCYLLLSSTPDAPGSSLALALAERMIAKHLLTDPLTDSSEEILYLYATVLQRQGKHGEALTLLDDPVPRKLRERNMEIDALRRLLLESTQAWETIRIEAKEKVDQGDRNWATLLALTENSTRAAEAGSTEVYDSTSTLLASLTSSPPGSSDRSLRLAQLELVRQRHCSALSAPADEIELLRLCEAYFETFRSKPCCYEDMVPYVHTLSPENKAAFVERIRKPSGSEPPMEDLKEMHAALTTTKLETVLQLSHTEASDVGRARRCTHLYLRALPLGKDLAATEMQPADDFALLAAQALVTASTDSTAHLYSALAILSLACERSPKGYQLRMLRVRILLYLGHWRMAHDQYRQLGIKAVQADTLSHLLLSRLSAFAPALSDAARKKDVGPALEAAQDVYRANEAETLEVLVQSFVHRTYSRVEEFVDFYQRLRYSANSFATRLEGVRCVAAVGKINEETLKVGRKTVEEVLRDFQEGNGPHDQRDYSVMPSYHPEIDDVQDIETQTSIGPRTDTEWLRGVAYVAAVTYGVEVDWTPPSPLPASLTTQEAALVALAQQLAEAEKKSSTTEFYGFFQDLADEIVSKPTSVPWRTLHTASILIEGHSLLRSVSRRTSNSASAKFGSALSEARTQLLRASEHFASLAISVRQAPADEAHRDAGTNGTPAVSFLDGAGEDVIKALAERVERERKGAIVGFSEACECVGRRLKSVAG